MEEDSYIASVIHDFMTTSEGEITINKGDILQVFKKVDKHWSYVLYAGRYGNVPTKCLIEIEAPKINDEEEIFVAHAHFHSQQHGDLTFTKGALIVGVKPIDVNWWQGRIGERCGIFPITYTWQLDSAYIKARSKEKLLNIPARVKMNMTAKLEDEMDLYVGEIVTITQIVDKLWYRGVCGNRSGIFPSAYVEMINPEESSSSDMPVLFNETVETPALILFSPDKEQATQKTDNMLDISLAEIFNDDYFKVNMPTICPQEQQSTNTIQQERLSLYESQPSMELDIAPYGISLYPFHAQYDNELSFHEGEIINLMHYVDKFWMEGTIDGKKGIFPTNYVDILVDCEEPLLVDLTEPCPIASGLEPFPPNSFASALFNFDGQMNGDLSVIENQVVLILRQVDNDWCEVKDRSGNVGLCPRNHLTAYIAIRDRHSSIDYCEKYPPSDATTTNTGKLERSQSVSIGKVSNECIVKMDVKTSDGMPHRPAPPIPVAGQKPVRKALPRPNTNNTNFEIINEETSKPEDKQEECKKKNQEQRQNVISELVYTEKEYVRDLKITYETFNLYNPCYLENKGIDVQTVFGNILEVMQVAEKLLDCLQLAMKGKNDDKQSVGPCFLNNAEEMKNVYGTYCMNHDNALILLEKYETDEDINKIFEKGLETLRHQIACFNMGSILIKPVQRILKYPLILNELIKCTSNSHEDYPSLTEAVQTMTRVASFINECKRRKDIVNKYLEDGNTTISSKMSRISLHSVAKKSSRFSVMLTSSLGFGNVTKDPVFDQHEAVFQAMVKSISAFQRNVDSLLSCLHEEIMMELDIAESIVCFYQESNVLVDQFHSIQRLVNHNFWPDFKQLVKVRTEKPLATLLELFQGPSILVQKRHNKLLDYDGCLAKAEKNKDNRLVQEELCSAKKNYEALNSHLLEELPVLIELASDLFVECLGAFVTARKLLSGKITKQYLTLMEMPSSAFLHGDPVDTCSVKHSLVLNQFSRLMFATKSLKLEQKHPSSLSSETTQSIQSSSQKVYLQNRYSGDMMYKVIRPYKAQQVMELTVSLNHLVAVLKKQNPMGDSSLWFVDDGTIQGFLPSICLEKLFSNETISTPTSSRPGNMFSNDTITKPTSSRPGNLSSNGTINKPSSSRPGNVFSNDTINKPTSSRPGNVFSNDTINSSTRSRPGNVFSNDTINSSTRSRPGISGTSARPQEQPPSYEQVVDGHTQLPSGNGTIIYDEIPGEEPMPEFYYAMYDFEGNGAHSLSVKTGQVLSVIFKQDLQGNNEWWFVEDRYGVKGYVPGNFLMKYSN